MRTVSAALPGNKKDVGDEENAHRRHHGCPFAQNGDLGTSRFKGQLPIAYTILAWMVAEAGPGRFRTISCPMRCTDCCSEAMKRVRACGKHCSTRPRAATDPCAGSRCEGLSERTVISVSGTFRTCRVALTMSVDGWWSQPVDATLYLRGKDGVWDGTEIS